MIKKEVKRMKQEFIIGDIVMYKNRIHTIIDILASNGYELSYVRHPVSPVRLSGVPLTPEILEKNGWNKEGKDGSDFSLSEVFMGGDEDDEDNFTCFQLYYQNKKDGWVIDMRGEPLKFEVHYVHELQHLLFGLGLNSEMEV